MHQTAARVPRAPRVRGAAVATAVLALAVAGLTAAPAAVAAPTTASVTPATAGVAPATADAAELVAAMQPGWNLGNALDAIPDETSWGNPPVTRAHFDAVRAAGFRSVRIPVTWSDHQQSSPPYPIETARLDRVRAVVDEARAAGLSVLVNVHHDSWQWIRDLPQDHDGVLARFRATWTQIATALRDEPTTVAFESVNEPQFTGTTDAQADTLVTEVNRAFHEVVRATGGGNATRLLVLPVLAGLGTLADTITSLDDGHLAATVHYYGWWPFSVNIAGKTTFDADSRKDLLDWSDRVAAALTARGIPVIVGEYGLLSYDPWTHPGTLEDGEVRRFFEEFGYQARSHGFTTMLWDAGSFLDRSTLTWRDPELAALILSSTTTRSGTASSDQLFLPGSGAIPSRSLTLNRNGTSFTGLSHGATALSAGTDYTVAGDQLTLTSAALTRLAGDRHHGVDATLYAHFSAGVPWRIEVVTADQPVLSSATGTTSSFTVPTDFRGDRLATVEARYDDGSNAGPANWTSYQEFGRCLARDYAAGTISVLPDFLTSLTDGSPVTMTFHFWSGATARYSVTRSGTTVRGTAPA